MDGEQMQLMRVIEFPKNKQAENIHRHDKLEVAILMLRYLVGEGVDFHVVIDREGAATLFEDEGLRDYAILTTDKEKSRDLKIDKFNSKIYAIQGDEF